MSFKTAMSSTFVSHRLARDRDFRARQGRPSQWAWFSLPPSMFAKKP